jgi:hypothetical protein
LSSRKPAAAKKIRRRFSRLDIEMTEKAGGESWKENRAERDLSLSEMENQWATVPGAVPV